VSFGVIGEANLIVSPGLSPEAEEGALVVPRTIAAAVAERKRKGATERETILTQYAKKGV
jgi:hypothetical protein